MTLQQRENQIFTRREIRLDSLSQVDVSFLVEYNEDAPLRPFKKIEHIHLTPTTSVIPLGKDMAHVYSSHILGL